MWLSQNGYRKVLSVSIYFHYKYVLVEGDWFSIGKLNLEKIYNWKPDNNRNSWGLLGVQHIKPYLVISVTFKVTYILKKFGLHWIKQHNIGLYWTEILMLSKIDVKMWRILVLWLYRQFHIILHIHLDTYIHMCVSCW